MKEGLHREYYSHVPLMPIISGLILIRRWRRSAEGGAGSPLAGIAVAGLGAAFIVMDLVFSLDLITHAEIRTCGSILIVVGTFLGFYGAASLRKALFPFLFLVFMIPLPLAWMEHFVSALVAASAVFSNMLFAAFGVPFVQEGSLFRLPDFDIIVAEACSGIRSSLALLITSVLAAQLFLNRPWKKAVLALAVFPVTVFKNAVRIVTLYLLSYFIDMRIIQGGFLHRSGGFIFFGLGLVMMGFMLWLLKNPKEAWEKVSIPLR